MVINKLETKKAYLMPSFIAIQAAMKVPTIFAMVTAPLIKLAEAKLCTSSESIMLCMLAVPPTQAMANNT